MKKVFINLFFIFFGVSLQANAQVFTNPIPPQINIPNQIWRNFRMGQIGNQMAADMARARQSGGKRSPPPKQTAKKTANGNPAVYRKQFAFQRSENSPLAQKIADAQKANSAQKANAGQKANSKDAARLQPLINYMWKNYETSFADENRRLGMPFNDAVAALTYFIVGSYLYANDITSLDSENSVAVYRQLAEIMSKDAEFTKLQPADKQLFAELLITLAGMPVANFEQNRNKNELKNSAAANLEKIFGDKAKNLQITADGIEF